MGDSASTPWIGSSLPERGSKMNIESYEESDMNTGDISFNDPDDGLDFLDELES